MANHELRPIAETVNLLLAFKRKSKGGGINNKCFRTIIRNYEDDLIMLENRCKLAGGRWRIHKTVNARDTKKAKIWMLHKLIETNQFDGCIDSLWRTALLQSECKAEKNFLFDVDTKDQTLIKDFEIMIRDYLIQKTESPNGYHFITRPFDTREVCKLYYVTLIRDGYVFVKKIGE